MEPVLAQPRTETQIRVNTFVQSVYNWMAVGLAVTGLVAWTTANVAPLRQLVLGNPVMPFVLMIGSLALVFTLSARINRMQASTATGLFVLYSGLMGAMLSSIFIVYTPASIATTFFVCSGMFLALSLYGWRTQRDLTSMGGFLFMGLIGIILASVVNLFLKSTMLQWMVSYLGVAIFLGLTAYDTQRIKEMALTQPADVGDTAVRRAAILGALTLYLDFINLFLFLLRLLGDRK